MESLKRNRTMLNDDLRAASPDALYENKVLFSPFPMAMKESRPSWSWGSSKEMSHTLHKKDTLMLTDVLVSRKNLRGSHRNMIDGNDDLGLLNLIAEQTVEKKGREEGPRKKLSKDDKDPDAVEEETRALIGALRGTEKRVIAKMGLSEDAIEKVARLFVKFRGPGGPGDDEHGLLQKRALRSALQRKLPKGAFNAEQFEEIWRTLSPSDQSAVSFSDLMYWASQYLPFDFLHDDGGDDVSVDKLRAASRERQRMREAEEAEAKKVRVVTHVKYGIREDLLKSQVRKKDSFTAETSMPRESIT